MKVLFHSTANYYDLEKKHWSDYMQDSLFHGFRSLLGADCVDYPKLSYMYRGCDFLHLFPSKGFSLYNRLDDIDVPLREQAMNMEFDKFDLAVVPIHHSINSNREEIENQITRLSRYFPANRLFVICGDDRSDSHLWLKNDRRITFFKRELDFIDNVYPISFSIPEENIVTGIPEKYRHFAPLMPCFKGYGHSHESTYIYDNEKKYNDDYRASYFGFTCSKGGWDCLRHYEIIANGCMPFFTDIEQCPQYTMTTMPRRYLSEIKTLRGILLNTVSPYINPQNMRTVMTDLNTTGHTIDMKFFPTSFYYQMLHSLLVYARKNLTTKAVANRLLTICSSM